jgi:hypothetical protein
MTMAIFLIPLVVMTVRFFPHSWLINSFVTRVTQSLVRASKSASCSRILLFKIDHFWWSELVVHARLSNSGTCQILYCKFCWWFDCQMIQLLRIDYVGELRSWYKVVRCDLPLHLWSAINPIASNEPWVMSLDIFQTVPFHCSFALSFHFLMFVLLTAIGNARNDIY